MRLTFELTEEDMLEAQALVLLYRRERIRRFLDSLVAGPFWRHLGFTLLIGVFAGLLVFPLAHRVARFDLRTTALAVVVASLIVTWIQRKIGVKTFEFRRLYQYSAKRQARAAIRRSILGPVTLTVRDDGIVRENQSGSLEVPWAEMAAVARNPKLLVVFLKSRRVLVVPERAIASAEVRDDLIRRIESGSGHTFVELPLL